MKTFDIHYANGTVVEKQAPSMLLALKELYSSTEYAEGLTPSDIVMVEEVDE